MLRTGYTEALEAAGSVEEQDKMANSPDSVGIEDTMEAVAWFWDQHFSAVAADNIGFEVMRPTKDGVDASGTTADYGMFLSALPFTKCYSTNAVALQFFIQTFCHCWAFILANFGT